MNKLVDQLIARRLLVPSLGSLLRIATWAVLTIVAISVVLPDRQVDRAADAYNRTASTEFVENVGSQRGDQRGFAPRNTPGFRIAWTAGSSIQSISPDLYTFIPIQVRDRLPTLREEPVYVDMYFLSGMRTVDEYAAVLRAIDSDPDMLVVTLNPLWALNDLAVQGWDNLDGHTAATNLTTPSAWPLTASLVGPADLAWGLAGTQVDVIEDRYHWGTRLSVRLEDVKLLDVAPAEDATPTELQKIAAMQIPVSFWAGYRPTVDPGAALADRQVALFERSINSQSSVSETALELLFEAVEQSGIPTYVYVAPVDPEAIANPETDRALAQIEDRLSEYEERYSSSIVHIDSSSAIRQLDPFEFNDIVHLAEVGPFADHLATKLCELARDNDIEANC